MKCSKCGLLYGNGKDDGVIVNPHLGDLCIHCWKEKMDADALEDKA